MQQISVLDELLENLEFGRNFRKILILVEIFENNDLDRNILKNLDFGRRFCENLDFGPNF